MQVDQMRIPGDGWLFAEGQRLADCDLSLRPESGLSQFDSSVV
jgi:hypothetical protein